MHVERPNHCAVNGTIALLVDSASSRCYLSRFESPRLVAVAAELGVVRPLMSSVHTKAFAIAVVHYALSFGIAFLAFAVAFGSALSDTYHGDAGPGLLGFVVVALQAPVALVQWLVIRASAVGKTGLQIPALLFLAIPSSLLYGYFIAFLSRSKPSNHDNNAT